MDKKIFLEILARYNRGAANREEVEFLEAYYELFDAEGNILNGLNSQEKLNIKNEISAGLFLEISNQKQKKIPFYYSKWWSVAAVLVLLTSLGIFYFKSEKPRVLITQTKKENIIKPGVNQAILTLADGSTIGLNESSHGVVVEEDGLKVTKGADGKISYDVEKDLVPSINTVATPRGGQYHLELPDGTKVWLNAASSIRFPTRFSGKTRTVDVTGEIYFEVASNKEMPFLVRTHHQQIEVLGTHFNVNAYEDELDEKTTLIEGSVKVAKLDKAANENTLWKVLRPGQEASIKQKGTQITVAEIDTDVAVAWKNGYFKFDKADIHAVMRQIARWYDVEVVYVGAKNEDLFVGEMKRTEDIRGVLKILELSKIKTSIKGRTIVIAN